MRKDGEILTTKKLITLKQWEAALKEEQSNGRPVVAFIIDQGYAPEKDVAQALSEGLGLAYVDLEKYSFEDEIVKILPQEIARKCLSIPLFQGTNSMNVAMANPADETNLGLVQKTVKVRIRPVLALLSQIRNRIEEEYLKGPAVMDFSQIIDTKDLGPKGLADPDTMKIASLAPVVSLVDQMVAKAVEMGASDVHIEPQADKVGCRFRIDGVLQEMPVLPREYDAAMVSRIKIMGNLDIAEKRLPQDGRVQMQVSLTGRQAGTKKVDLRISTFPTMHGENLVIRILDKTRSLIQLEELGMSSEILKVFDQLIHRPHGIILVTGPTGSGKTTTLYGVLNQINTVSKNIMTLEDPIEYEVERIRQSQVNVKAGLTFATGLRSIVRQDPDIIMIGEIRDRETAEIAIHAALTGHLVFSTLHTNNAASATARLIDMGVEPFLVSSALTCVVAQRLIRVLCPACKELYVLAPEMIEKLKIHLDPSEKIFREKGCSQCRKTGYQGRIGIFEMLVPDDELGRMIDEKAAANDIAQMAVKKGMTTLRDDGIQKFQKGITSLAEVVRVTQEN